MNTPSEDSKEVQRIAIGDRLQEALKDEMEAERKLNAAKEKINTDSQIECCLKKLVKQGSLIPAYAAEEKKEVLRTLEGLLKGKKEGMIEREAAQNEIDAARKRKGEYLGELTLL